MKYSRKKFLKVVGTGTLFSTVSPSWAKPNPETKSLTSANESSLTLGVASYSLREFSLVECIQILQRLRVKSVALKSMHMPLDSSPSQIKDIAQQVRDAGIDLYGAGVIYMKSEEAVNQAFAYAKIAGLRVIIGVPNPELLPLVEQRVKETDIKLAIHNHGPGDKVYPSPDSIQEKIKELDTRIGHCIDIGHTYRIGEDPAEKAKKYADRLYDVHLKDVDKVGAEGDSVELGSGIMDIPAFLQTLKQINYTGVVGMEYEKDGKDPLPGLAESVGYARGIMDGWG